MPKITNKVKFQKEIFKIKTQKLKIWLNNFEMIIKMFKSSKSEIKKTFKAKFNK